MANVDGNKRDYVLKLNKNLYGMKQAGRVWYEHLKKGLIERGFKQSEVDECVFYKGDLIFVVYVDDIIILCPDQRKIDRVVKSLKKGFDLTDEGDLTEYLGIRVDKTKKKGLKLTQPTLIRRIIAAVRLDSKKHKPAATPGTKVLLRDLGGLERETTWDYRSVVGMLNFLCQSTRPDLSFAVSQAAQFLENPKRCHEPAVIKICKYLLGTMDDGMYMHPNGNSFEVYVDADFAGGYNKGHTDDPDTAKSRAAYHIMYNGCSDV